ncbi:MAG TPA: alpha/beta hydrolase [Longimicrobium sp.]|nr:alpha/beta hydrolase [Longimicrobium sp.]
MARVRALFVGTVAMVSLSACASGLAARSETGARFQSDRITVTTSGSGPDVILVPGLASSAADVWAGTVAAVPGYRYHLVQVHGFAGVPAGANGDGGPVVAPLVEEVARYIREARLERPAFIGHSLGGGVGLALAVRHPDAVSRLMVVDMVPWMGTFFGPPGTVTPETAGPIAERVRAAWETPDDEPWRRLHTSSVNSMIQTESLRPRAIDSGIASDRGVAARAMRDLILQDLRADLARVAIPIRVLYVQGPHLPLDAAQADAVFRAAYAAAPRVTLERIPNAWHFIMLDQPERFADEVRAFLRR